MTKHLEVGKTYTSKNGDKWYCIAVDGDVAHMRHDSDKTTSAYAWRRDGTSVCLPDHDFRIVFEPERGEVVLTGGRHSFVVLTTGGRHSFDEWNFDDHGSLSVKSNRLTIPTLDGELATGTYTGSDGHEIKVEKL